MGGQFMCARNNAACMRATILCIGILTLLLALSGVDFVDGEDDASKLAEALVGKNNDPVFKIMKGLGLKTGLETDEQVEEEEKKPEDDDWKGAGQPLVTDLEGVDNYLKTIVKSKKGKVTYTPDILFQRNHVKDPAFKNSKENLKDPAMRNPDN